MKPNFKNIDIYAGFQPQNGMEWQKENGITADRCVSETVIKTINQERTTGLTRRKNAFFCILFFTDSRKSLHESINEAKTTGRTIPVSYTHLDVYKRQHIDRCTVIQTNIIKETTLAVIHFSLYIQLDYLSLLSQLFRKLLLSQDRSHFRK